MDRAAVWAPRHDGGRLQFDRAQASYAVGDKIARFTLFAQSSTEIVTGGDDKHLDFRVSVRKLGVQGATHVALSAEPICARYCRFIVLERGRSWQTRWRRAAYNELSDDDKSEWKVT
jgi:hypothetical protein